MAPLVWKIGVAWAAAACVAAVPLLLLSATELSAQAAASTRGSATSTLLASVFEPSIALLRQALDRQPSMLLAGSVAATVPIVATFAAIGRCVGRLFGSRRSTAKYAAAGHADEHVAPKAAWIVDANRQLPPVRVGEIAHIGSGEDCDISLDASATAQMNAVIQRTTDCEFFVLDLGGEEHRAVTVNGTRSRRCRLNDGDQIQIGSARFVFRLDGRGVGGPLAQM